MYYFKCPKCRNQESFYLVDSEDLASNMGCLFYAVFGIVGAPHFASTRKPNTQCGECGYVFCKPSLPMGPVARLLFGSLLLLFASVWIGFFVDSEPYLDLDYPLDGILLMLTQYVSEHSAGVGAAIVFFLTAFTILSPIIFMASIIMHRRKMTKLYQTKVQDPPPRKPSNPSETEVNTDIKRNGE